MKVNKLISVVVPVYNTEEYLGRCLDSLLKQTYPHLQIIVVNDGSSGNTREIVEHYQSRDSRIVYTEHERNMGLFKARVTGSLLAEGDYLAFVDSDDYVGIDFYRLLVTEAERHQADMILARTVLVERDRVVFNLHDVAFPDEALRGKAVFQTFLAQEGRCYSWHTVWNKLYSRSLWERCLPYYQTFDEHVVMMEDVAFSFPLFYFASHVMKVENSVYYYCQNKGSSTDTKTSSRSKVEKNLSDIFKVFAFVRCFLHQVGVSEQEMRNYESFRDYYVRLWKTGIGSITDEEDRRKIAKLFSERFGEAGEFTNDDRLFRAIRTDWNDQLEEVKQKIVDPAYEYISFDIFDTLVLRPFLRPTDLFYLLDGLYEMEMASGISFHQLRIDGEIAARDRISQLYPEYQDVTLDEIYFNIHDMYGVPHDLCERLKEQEKQLELKFSTVRKTGKELFDLAIYAGKKVVLISDMYLDELTIRLILAKHGYEGYDRIFLSSTERLLKNTGDLFQRALDELQVSAERILHIGDNYQSDILKARECGMAAFYFPRTLHVFDNAVKNLPAGECSSLAEKIGGVILDREKLRESVGFGAMLAMAANVYFDNPFRPFNNDSDLNADPYFIGYYALGMHLAGIVQWILRRSGSYERILFMARDGYLVKQAYDRWTKHLRRLAPASDYLLASRRMLLPYIAESVPDLMNLPIVYHQYSPEGIFELLDFCTKPVSSEQAEEMMEAFGFGFKQKFKSKYHYQCFMRMYIEHFYDQEAHELVKRRLKEYYQGIRNTDVAFDMGYSGNIQHALVKAAGKPVDVLYMHGDAVRHQVMSRKGGFHIESFYDFSPAISGLLREHILSEVGPSCVGVTVDRSGVKPVFDEYNKPYTDTFILQLIHRGALQFIDDFVAYFGDHLDHVTFKSYEVSLPFEAFVRLPKPVDLQIFEGSYFEDKVYGRHEMINIAKFMTNQFNSLPHYSGDQTLEFYKNAIIDNIKYRRKLVYFGAGMVCREMLKHYPDIPVSFILDNNEERAGEQLAGLVIRHPDQIEHWQELFIIITTYRSGEIEKQLKELGLQKHKDFVAFQEMFQIT